MEAIGLCSNYSRQGDWAFDYAFRLASEKDIQLNIFHWLESPFRFRREIVYADEKKTINSDLVLTAARSLKFIKDAHRKS